MCARCWHGAERRQRATLALLVVTDPTVKKKIRIAAEKEEHEFYHHKETQEWLDALAPLGTNEHKAFLEKCT